MNVVVVGDIGWQFLYHLGDEAMTEAAIDMLRDRQVDQITLVAGQPAVSEAFYGLPCVTRVGFKSGWSRRGNAGHLRKVATQLADATYDEKSIFAAIRDCDVVLIAGGGNMNSRDYHLLYERVAAKRIAEHFGKPLYVSSQTVGPMLLPEDRDLVVEIADYANAFGCREATTTALMRRHVARPDRVHHTLDDASVLTSDSKAREVVQELAGDKRFVVASFTNHHGSIWANRDSYYSDIAAACAAIASDNDVEVLLAPHAGSLDPAQTSRDQESNEIIAKLADSPRVRATRMITAREDVALIEAAVLSLSTRYHPTIFGPSAATPTIGIAPSYYSSIRMRGSMRNVGLERFVLPTSSMHLLRDAAREAIGKDESLARFLESARERALGFQHAWWDGLTDAMRTGSDVNFTATLEAEAYVPAGSWSAENEIIIPVFDNYAKTVDLSKELAGFLKDARESKKQLTASVEATQEKLTKAESDLEQSRATVSRYKNRKVVRLADKLGRMLPGR
ncbi:polysaccharide pyruvyl transferase family protein [Demequina oxidasica]|uniref:polysaccharide pyruvyl transferase family protein n=1 Tax=Demequina oxidasica TaxID=676199 RepID=UPI0007843783|nr:polysaccharide pyruvyl transferase family protein [Demequina oxidasica]